MTGLYEGEIPTMWAFWIFDLPSRTLLALGLHNKTSYTFRAGKVLLGRSKIYKAHIVGHFPT